MTKPIQEFDAFAAAMPRVTRDAVRSASQLKTVKRREAISGDFDDPDGLRRLGADIKQHTLDHLADYLEQAEAALRRNGASVHWASDAEEANAIACDIILRRGGKRVVKAKSMVTEETRLSAYLEARGIEALETDLGEFIVQIDGDHPSHIVTPIIHKNRKQIAESFAREGLGEYTEDPQELTAIARRYLRKKYLEADVGMTGGNFLVAESGRVVLATNEGNGRFTLAATKTHIAMVGIEKLVPRDRDVAPLLALLARSATGQRMTVYTQFLGGPKRADRPEGPEEMHVILVDNGRTATLESECREILRCIRCGACMNICPVYRQASGHAYRSVYPGPVGAVLSPLLHADGFAPLADLPKASSLCGACQEVCPVDIPIPDMLVRLRRKGKEEGAPRASVATPDFALWAKVASSPSLWRASLKLGHALNFAPRALLGLEPSAKSWLEHRDLPRFDGGAFRKWLAEERNGKGGTQP